MTAKRSDPTRTITAIAAGVSLVIALGVPTAYFADEYEELEKDSQADADALAGNISRLVLQHSDHWKFLSHYDDVLGRSAYRHEARRMLFDREGQALGRHGGDPAWPALQVVSDVYDSGTPVGQVVVDRSVRDLLGETALVTLFAALFGGLMFYAVRHWPLRALRRALGELEVAGRAFESTADGVIIYDAQRRIVSVNKAFTAITGYEDHEVVGKHADFLRSGQHDDKFYRDLDAVVDERSRWQGEMKRRRKNGELYPALCSISVVKDGEGAVTNYVTVFNDISSFKEHEAKLEFIAHHDALTGLPNRALFQERFRQTLIRARRHKGTVAALFIDLDQFKTINDSLGHHAGDELLQVVATRLQECVRETDVVARLGGDEFTVLLDELKHSQDAGRVAEKIVAALGKPYAAAGHELSTSASIGISCYPDDGDDVETLLKNADAAMYKAKEQGRNNYQFFSADLNTRAHDILVMKNNLRLALERGEFVLNYQPRYNLSSGRITGLEALVRWQHPTLGLVAPGNFIPLAEDSGLIVPLGEWVLQTACAQMKQWRALGWDRLRVAVNVSPRQFRQANFGSRISAILRQVDVTGNLLELEITEGVVMHDPGASEKMLRELRANGIAIAIDDFGTGYSSLSYLKRFPLDYLKIDRAFVRNLHESPEDVAIVQAIIALARALNLAVIAEGLEKEEQRKLLVLFGCQEAQGFLFSRPRPAPEIEELLTASRLAV